MSKIGEVYAIDALSPTRYFQLAVFDSTQLNSDVIAVYKHAGDLALTDKGLPDLAQLENTEVEFFTHTTVNSGIREGLWSKIGKLGVVNLDHALFKDADYGDKPPEVESNEADSFDNWVVWHPNEAWQHIGASIKDYPAAELGMVFSAQDGRASH